MFVGIFLFFVNDFFVLTAGEDIGSMKNIILNNFD
jgi:hypothetical protein